MRLADLHPVFLSHGGPGVTTAAGEPIPLTLGVGVLCDCPCGNADEEHRLYVPFVNPIGPGPALGDAHRWQRTGDTFETLSLTPSILRIGGCGWHGFITNGEVLTA